MPKRGAMVVVHSWDELPKFQSEEAEADFWATHALGDELLEEFQRVSPEGDDWLPPARPRTKPIAVRFDESTLGRLKVLAGRRHKGYQSLLKEFVVERLYEEEKREGLVGAGERVPGD
ncbi:MAG: CopG family antitoxin [Thermoplasmata archaeon]